MRTLIVITGLGPITNSDGRTIAVYTENKKVTAVYRYQGIINESLSKEFLHADKKILLLDDSTCRTFVFSKDRVSKRALFAETAKKLGNNEFIYSIIEHGKYYVVPTAHNIYAHFGFDYVGSFELTVGFGMLKKFKRNIVLKGVRNMYLVGEEIISIANRIQDVKPPANCIILSPFRDFDADRDSANEAIKEIQQHIKGTVARPWVGMRVSISKSVLPQLAEWAYVTEFVNTEVGNMVEERFKETTRREMPYELKTLVKAVAIILLAPIISYTVKFIPYSLPFTPINAPSIPKNLVVTTTAQLERFIYQKGNTYSLYYIVSNKKRIGYFISKEDAIKAAKNKNWKVVKVQYENGNEANETPIYP